MSPTLHIVLLSKTEEVGRPDYGHCRVYEDMSLGISQEFTHLNSSPSVHHTQGSSQYGRRERCGRRARPSIRDLV